MGKIGIKDTPVHAMIHATAGRLQAPLTLVALVADGKGLSGTFIGDHLSTWNEAVELSAERHIRWCEQPFQRVLSCAPSMYDELWTGAKVMYKLEPAVAMDREVIIYAPHLNVINHLHGEYIFEIGHHTLPYLLNAWEQFKHISLGVLAHSTHVRVNEWKDREDECILHVPKAGEI